MCEFGFDALAPTEKKLAEATRLIYDVFDGLTLCAPCSLSSRSWFHALKDPERHCELKIFRCKLALDISFIERIFASVEAPI